jgi:predicted Fe-S protein YdhL (DUF1289 family)
LADDLLEGADEIAEWYFGDPKRRRAIYHLVATRRIRVFRRGQTICARKSTLLADIAEQERSSSRTEGEAA